MNSVNQVGEMLAVKNEMYELVQENYKLRVKATERNKDREIEELRRRVKAQSDRIKEKEEEERSSGWEKGEKQRVLEDFNHLKGLYDKDRRRMEGLVEDAERRLRSVSAQAQAIAAVTPVHQPYSSGFGARSPSPPGPNLSFYLGLKARPSS